MKHWSWFKFNLKILPIKYTYGFKNYLSRYIQTTLVCRDLRKIKETKKQFDKVSEEKEVALVKNGQVPRNKTHEVEEATNILTTTRKCFRHIALDYVLQVRVHGKPLVCLFYSMPNTERLQKWLIVWHPCCITGVFKIIGFTFKITLWRLLLVNLAVISFSVVSQMLVLKYSCVGCVHNQILYFPALRNLICFFQINVLQSKRRSEILKSVSSGAICNLFRFIRLILVNDPLQ